LIDREDKSNNFRRISEHNMEVLRCYTFKEVKAPEFVELFERVLAAVGKDAAAHARIVLVDAPLRASSTIERAVKRHPELARYRLPEIHAINGVSTRMLSNVDSHHSSGAPCDFPSPDLMRALLRGIPRAYPFWRADFLFTRYLPWQAIDAVEPVPSPPECWNLYGECFPRMSFCMNGRASGYRASVHAAISLGEAEAFETALPTVPFAISSLLAPFGRAKTRLMLHRTRDEANRLTETTTLLRAMHEEWMERSRREMAKLALPHTLTSDGTKAQLSPLTLPHKRALVDTFKPRGYQYSKTESGAGCFVLHKLTSNRNRIEIFFDVGSISRRYSGGMSVAGIQGRCFAPLPAHPEQQQNEYDIASNEEWLQIIENIAILVDHLERVFVPEVEAKLGQTPEWYEW
jgi:hypothetical protein